MSQTFTLPESLRLPGAVDLRNALTPLIESGESLTVDAAGVNSADTAGLQILLCASKTLAQKGASLQIDNPAEALARIATTAGVNEALGIEAVH